MYPKDPHNLVTEFKNLKGAKKADGAILVDGKAIAVIELKGTNTKDLESIRQQAFDYKSHHPTCQYIITSNFEKLRFYIQTSNEVEEFNLFNLIDKSGSSPGWIVPNPSVASNAFLEIPILKLLG